MEVGRTELEVLACHNSLTVSCVKTHFFMQYSVHHKMGRFLKFKYIKINDMQGEIVSSFNLFP